LLLSLKKEKKRERKKRGAYASRQIIMCIILALKMSKGIIVSDIPVYIERERGGGKKGPLFDNIFSTRIYRGKKGDWGAFTIGTSLCSARKERKGREGRGREKTSWVRPRKNLIISQER